VTGPSPTLEAPSKLADPRIFQILFLGVLLSAGVLWRDFSLHPAQFGLALLAATLTQAVCNRAAGIPGAGVRSAVITGFGLSILLRADSLWVHPAAAAFAIAQKFVLRVRGKHLLNPANSGVLLALTLLPGTWVSGGQWGQDVAMAGWVVAFGTLVVTRARRLDVSWSFLGFWLGAMALRAGVYGYEWAVWQHQLQNGALLLFAFFMISDPMTIPNHPRGRIAHAALVAAVAYAWQYRLYEPNGLLWALFLCSPAVPLWDLAWKAPRFQWIPERSPERPGAAPAEGGHRHETDSHARDVAHRGVALPLAR
jgi:enediyne biosynthesis protein E5